MTDEDYIGYLLDLLDPADRSAVAAHLAATPAAAARLVHLRALLAPLEADRDPDPPRPGLAARTVGRVAAYLVEHEPRPQTRDECPVGDLLRDLGVPQHSPAPDAAEPARPPVVTDRPEPRAVGGRFRIDLLVAAGIACFGVGLVLSGIGRWRYESEKIACQNNLRFLHQGLVGYADRHGGRFPQVGTDPHPTAETFVTALIEEGQIPPGFANWCPADRRADRHARYAYSLGYAGANGQVVGLSWADAPTDLLPIAADYPTPASAPGNGSALVSPHRNGQNVLSIGGNVRFCTTPFVGVDGDDIYRNRAGKVARGEAVTDTVLGRDGDRP